MALLNGHEVQHEVHRYTTVMEKKVARSHFSDVTLASHGELAEKKHAFSEPYLTTFLLDCVEIRKHRETANRWVIFYCSIFSVPFRFTTAAGES